VFRAIIMLDCDKCHQPFLRAVTAEEYDDDSVGPTLQDATHVLMSWAADAGWDVYKRLYICKDCIADRDDSRALFLACPSQHSPP
jgi:hypothetical protein